MGTSVKVQGSVVYSFV